MRPAYLSIVYYSVINFNKVSYGEIKGRNRQKIIRITQAEGLIGTLPLILVQGDR